MRIWLIKTGEEMPDDPHGPRLVRMAVLADYLYDRLFKRVEFSVCDKL